MSKVYDNGLHMNMNDYKIVDVFYLVLMDLCEGTLLPELYETIGVDKFAEFMNLFGGMRIDIPDKSLFVKAAKETEAYIRHEKGESIESVASRLSMLPAEVRSVVAKLKGTLIN